MGRADAASEFKNKDAVHFPRVMNSFVKKQVPVQERLQSNLFIPPTVPVPPSPSPPIPEAPVLVSSDGWGESEGRFSPHSHCFLSSCD